MRKLLTPILAIAAWCSGQELSRAVTVMPVAGHPMEFQAASNPAGVKMAETFPGADCGAKINAADESLGSAAGEIWVTQACGMGWTTNVKLSTGHVLRFIQGGAYNIGASGSGVAISMATKTYIFGSGFQGTVLRANATFTGTMVQTTAGLTRGDNGIAGFQLDGNFAAVVGADFSTEAGSFIRDVYIARINSSVAASNAAGGALYIHDTQGLSLNNVWVNQCGGDCVRIVDSWAVNTHQLFAERPSWTARGAAAGGTGAAVRFVRNTERSAFAGSNLIDGLHVEWEPEAADARQAVLIDGSDNTFIRNYSAVALGASRRIANAIKVINTSNGTGPLAYELDGYRTLQGTVTNLVNDTITGSVVAVPPSGKYGLYSSLPSMLGGPLWIGHSAANASALFLRNKTSTTTQVLGVAVQGDAVDRFAVRGDGALQWGPGNGAADTDLYRNGVGALHTDGDFEVSGRIHLYNGAPTVGSGFPAFRGRVTDAGISSTQGSANILASTAPATQQYRVGYTLWQATSGSGGTCNTNATAAVAITWTDPAGQAHTFHAGPADLRPTLGSGAPEMHGGPAAGFQSDQFVIVAKASTAITRTIAWVNGNCAIQPTASVMWFAESVN